MAEELPFLEDGSQFGVSRSAFRRMRKAEKRQLMVQWFFENYEDPANKTPRLDNEFHFIWGGPYDARDELYSKFGDVASESLIEEVVKEVERGGLTDWAPVRTVDEPEETEPPDDPPSLDSFLDEPSPRYGSAAEQEARARARAALDELRRFIDQERPVGIGHNWPPLGEDTEELQDVGPAVDHLRTELAKTNPAISLIKQWAKPLRDALIATGKWAGRKFDKAIDAASSAAGIGAAAWLWAQYSQALSNAFNAIVEWLRIAANALSN
jgi:hypothetical protein